MVLSDSGEIVQAEFFVKGRKHSLLQMRTKMLRNHEKYMRDMSIQDFTAMSSELLAK